MTSLAQAHLPAPAAEEFLAMLRPALRLVHAGEGDPVVAQLGGLPTLPINSWPVWEPVEMEVEQLRRGLGGEPFAWDDPATQSAASNWQLLLQVASDDDAGMMWGDVGQLYYLVSDMERPDEALFTWQCG